MITPSIRLSGACGAGTSAVVCGIASLAVALWTPGVMGQTVYADPVRAANVNAGALSTVAGDFNRDGRAEFVSAASKNSAEAHFRIYSYDSASQGFVTYNLLSPAAVSSRQDRFGGDLDVGDMNNDGFPDIIVPESNNANGPGRVSWFENPGGNLGGTWIEHVIGTWTGSLGDSVAHMAEVAVGDIDRDGWLDVVTRDVSHGCFIFLRNHSGTGWQTRRFLATNPREGLVLWNPDGDADLDILINGVWFATPADPLNGFYIQHTISAPWYPANSSDISIADYASKVDVGDFNGDGWVDVVVTNGEKLLNDPSTASKPKGVRLYLSPADPVIGAWTEVILDPAHYSWQSLQIGDINRDGILDIVSGISMVGVENAPASIVAFLNYGSGTTFATQLIDTGKDNFNSDVYIYNSTLADADGDGDLDLFAPDNWNSGPIRYYKNMTPSATSQAPAAPANLTANLVSISRIDLAWSDQSNDESGFKIERAANSSTFVQIAQTGAGVIAFSDTGLAPDTAYAYRVRAFNAIGASAYSAAASATTLTDTTPPVVTSVSSTPNGIVTAVFSEPVEQASAENAANYSLGGGAVVHAGTLAADGRTVALATTGLIDATTYSLTAIGVRDLSAASNPSNTAATFVYAAWLSKDIGNVAATGSTVIAGPAITVAGSGADIYSLADGFRFTYRTLTGDGEVVARVISQTRANPYSKAGVMIRETLDSGSRHVSMALTPDFGGELNYRTSTGGTTGKVSYNPAVTPRIAAPYWVKLVRLGTLLTGSVSVDGVQWQQAGTATVSMAAGVFVGLAVTSHQDGSLSTARFENVGITVTPAPATITLGALTQTYNGMPRPVTATTTPSGLTVSISYNASATPPTNAGSYALAATITNENYQGTASGALVVVKATATIALAGLSQVYDGTPKPVTATTTPAGLTFFITYSGSANPPTAAGTYTVSATVNDLNYAGSGTGSLVIAPGNDWVSWRNDHFTQAEQTAGLAAENVDPDSDTRPNLAEYALGTDPRQFTPPLVATLDQNGLTLIFTRPANLPGVSYGAESSDNLATWTPVPLELLVPGAVETLRARLPLNSGNPLLGFMRLRFGRP